MRGLPFGERSGTGEDRPAPSGHRWTPGRERTRLSLHNGVEGPIFRVDEGQAGELTTATAEASARIVLTFYRIDAAQRQDRSRCLPCTSCSLIRPGKFN